MTDIDDVDCPNDHATLASVSAELDIPLEDSQMPLGAVALFRLGVWPGHALLGSVSLSGVSKGMARCVRRITAVGDGLIPSARLALAD